MSSSQPSKVSSILISNGFGLTKLWKGTGFSGTLAIGPGSGSDLGRAKCEVMAFEDLLV